MNAKLADSPDQGRESRRRRRVLRNYGYPRIIHGNTHAPRATATRRRTYQRALVMADWYKSGVIGSAMRAGAPDPLMKW